ncbi:MULTISPECIES: ABC transporter ATP-binding protein [unclassified Fusibacter]|uniref:ABC transporter ATP-binding protein n=1 Tax=unclassified Fusibacter TaxID=2624464 RepID=UPI001012A015|nr:MULTISPECIES: ABC transporter ATP-binding protein [unclassified Fusibacter]MCK8060300.1 ABC transporter ATP-binding protein [Fusibacter sp. A2]NPE20411.1 ABC transporter ATP-binding protein [Fusibacter sp. A1]RXV63616.1 ABC transporter ATP-binding protein [Fusibacter sp. A1]
MSIIQVIQLYKRFPMGKAEVEILKDIHLSVNEGEFVSIMGPSGSGKSTLLYLLGGLDKPSEGKVLIGGKDITIMKDKQESILRRRDIGFVFQFYNLVPNLNVIDNIMLPVLLDGGKHKDYQRPLSDILDIVGLSDKKKHTPRELSGGQQQRVAIARALINDPDIILADEPIGNLDSKTGTDIMKLFKTINKEKGKTVVQVTHAMESAAYSDRIIMVRDGRIIDHNFQQTSQIV